MDDRLFEVHMAAHQELRERERRTQDYVHRTADLVGLLTDWLDFSKDTEADNDDDAQWLAALRHKTQKHIDTLCR